MGLCLKYFIQPDENNAKPPEPTTATDAVLLLFDRGPARVECCNTHHVKPQVKPHVKRSLPLSFFANQTTNFNKSSAAAP